MNMCCELKLIIFCCVLCSFTILRTCSGVTLNMLAILPKSDGYFKFPFGQEMSGAAIYSALEEIERRGILPGYNFSVTFVDTGCKAREGLGNAYTALQSKQFDVVIGPQCSNVCRHIGRLAAYLNLPEFSGVCQGIEMLDKVEFRTLTRFLGTFEKSAAMVYEMVQTFRWTRVSVIWEKHPDIVWILTNDAIQKVMSDNNVTVARTEVIGDDQPVSLEEALKNCAAVSRIIILAIRGDKVRKIALLAYDQGLINGNYIFFSLIYYPQKRAYGDFNWKQNDGRDDDALKAYAALFFILYYNRHTGEEYIAFEQDVKTKAKQYFNFSYDPGEQVPYQAANVYEAVYLFARSVNETLAEGGEIKNGTLISQRLWNRSFDSITGALTLNANGDREQAFTVKHLQSFKTGEIQTIGHYFSINARFQFLPGIVVLWPGGRTTAPLDRPTCGYENEFCKEAEEQRLVITLAAVTATLVVTMVLVVSAVYFIYRRMIWLKAVNDMKWSINRVDIKQNKAANSMMSQVSFVSLGNKSGIDQQFIETGIYQGNIVAMKHMIHVKEVKLTNALKQEMKMLNDLTHSNVARFIGACIEPSNVLLITEYCPKGSLQDILENFDFAMDLHFKFSLINDILEGLTYIHDSYAKTHGNLKSSNCLVDNRFLVKLADFGPAEWYMRDNKPAKDLLWTAPEVLRKLVKVSTKEGDIYSLAIILQEVVERNGVFYMSESTYSSEDIVAAVINRATSPVRPTLDPSNCSGPLAILIQKCWADYPTERPSLKAIVSEFVKATGTRKTNIMDVLIRRMEKYANDLENLVEQRTAKYLEEKKRTEDLLHRLLPESIAKQIQAKGQVDPESYGCVSIYFSDIVGFTKLSSESKPIEIVEFLNDLYSAFDFEISRFDVYKVETIGDAYMVVSGMPKRNGDLHASEIGKMSLGLLNVVKTFVIKHRPFDKLLLRIGAHSGPCVAGVVGTTMPRYCLFGDTVNTASRMESLGEALKIHISAATNKLLESIGGFIISMRGDIDVKGKGKMTTYWLEGLQEETAT
ncbi:atrial natriuretic peptide receptor 2-like isoform X2 [Lineus longissimus]|uniref:atrial natriuretic peptide receptor 2-like isoform X2 n=1 Tax=Lineus longissimus TaxID=88925 RepID=UPI002B4F476D